MDEERIYGVVYLLTNLVNGKIYVGQTVNLKARIGNYRRCDRDGYAITRPIELAIKKYGWGNFICEQIATASSDEHLNKVETLWIICLQSAVAKIGYNRTLGGNNAPCSEETRRLQSEIGKRRGGPWQNGCPQEVREKMLRAWERRRLEALPKPPRPPKPPRQKRRQYKPPGFPKGCTIPHFHTEEANEKRHIAQVERWKERRRLGLKAVHSQEAMEKRSAMAKALYSSPEWRERLRSMAILRWSNKKNQEAAK